MVERVTRKNENLESELPLTISAQYGLIDQNEFFDKRIASRDVSGYYLLKKGEFAYNKSTSSDAPWGAVKRLDRYEMGVLSTLYIVFALKEDGNIDSDFLVSYYDTDCWHKGVQAIAAEGARNHGLLNITPADYFETVLTVPSDVKEQHQIGTFFAKLDTLITLHQRECFSFDFSGESAKTAQKTISWEQRKLGEVCQINGRIGFRGYTEKDIIPKEQGGVLAFTPTNIVNNQLTLNVRNTYITRVKYDESPEIMVKNGNILFVKTGSTLGKSALVTGFTEDSTVNPQVVVIKTDIPNQKILSTILTTDKVQSQVASVKIGGAVPTMTETELKNIELSMPINEDERIKIGAFFSKLDNIITLHQHKPNKKGHDVLSVMPFKGNQRKPHYLCT